MLLKFLKRGQAVFSFYLWVRLSTDKGRGRQDYKDSSFLNLDRTIKCFDELEMTRNKYNNGRYGTA